MTATPPRGRLQTKGQIHRDRGHRSEPSQEGGSATHSARQDLGPRQAYRVRPRIDKLILVAVRYGSDDASGWISDISISGMRVICEQAEACCLAWRDHVQVVFALAKGEPPLTIPGLVVRIESRRRYIQLGIRFDEHALARNQAVESKLTSYIMRRQRECLAIWRGWHQ
jgi:hypothetical protein